MKNKDIVEYLLGIGADPRCKKHRVSEKEIKDFYKETYNDDIPFKKIYIARLEDALFYTTFDISFNEIFDILLGRSNINYEVSTHGSILNCLIMYYIDNSYAKKILNHEKYKYKLCDNIKPKFYIENEFIEQNPTKYQTLLAYTIKYSNLEMYNEIKKYMLKNLFIPIFLLYYSNI